MHGDDDRLICTHCKFRRGMHRFNDMKCPPHQDFPNWPYDLTDDEARSVWACCVADYWNKTNTNFEAP